MQVVNDSIAHLTRIGNSPDRTETIVAHEQRSVWGYGDPDRAAPSVAIVHDKAGDEVLIFPARSSRLMQWNANDFVSQAHRFIPGSVFRSENISLEFRWKLFAVVKSHFK